MTRHETVREAILEPGDYVERNGFAERWADWQARAVLVALDSLEAPEPRRNRALVERGPA